jgi:hypothetical protein
MMQLHIGSGGVGGPLPNKTTNDPFSLGSKTTDKRLPLHGETEQGSPTAPTACVRFVEALQYN